jgi:uncharacterized protein YprB with RNaseH-like and TPR domain
MAVHCRRVAFMSMDLARRLRERQTRASSQPPLAQDILGGREIEHPGGTLYLITDEWSGELPWPSPGDLDFQLQLLHGIGPYNEGRLQAEGYHRLEDLVDHPRWGGQAKGMLAAIDKGDVYTLRQAGACDWDLVGMFRPEQAVFLDIETTGLVSSRPLFLVGIIHWQGGVFYLKQYLARNFEEEGPLLSLVVQKLKDYPLIFTYNGKTFDLPFIKARCLSHGLPLPKGHLHVDLLSHARRAWQHQLPNCRLTTVEDYCLQSRPAEDIPGALIPEIYYHFVETQDVGAIEGVIRHNALDLDTLTKLIPILQKPGLDPQPKGGRAYSS